MGRKSMAYPSKGVRPIEVSRVWPCSIAVTDAPAPAQLPGNHVAPVWPSCTTSLYLYNSGQLKFEQE